ncbi:conjugative transposon protein TraM [Pedobacter jeongneungensis]|uniref:conjugative transposon protein TraM n=1 Tax=Pedobacter jeongneungensis TaxID=947309 RepID=UPI00046A39AD|nr:conjugative transposon protein TraM [Pedobacter jeongneungensis]
MTENINTPAFKAKRKMYTIAPLAFIPIFAFLFDLLGGGTTVAAVTKGEKKTFDMSIPDAKVTDIATKDEAYIQADEESRKNSIVNDFDVNSLAEKPSGTQAAGSAQKISSPDAQQAPNANKDVEQILQKYYKNQGTSTPPPSNERYTGSGGYSGYSPKRQPVLHKEREVTEKTGEAIDIVEEKQDNPLFFGGTSRKKNIPDKSSSDLAYTAPFRAVVHGEQAVSPSGSIKMRTTEPIVLNNITLPANSFIFGTVEIRREDRINIKINSIRVKQELINVNMSVYDVDGQEGIHVTGGNLKEKTDQIIDGVNAPSELSNLPVIGNVAEATKNLFRKKRGNNSIIIGSSYKLLIKSN